MWEGISKVTTNTMAPRMSDQIQNGMLFMMVTLFEQITIKYGEKLLSHAFSLCPTRTCLSELIICRATQNLINPRAFSVFRLLVIKTDIGIIV
jgi:hypothetical protein